ncbi:MAG: DUF3990 domain-containing protein [Bacteroidales bacterium]|nr:DUF3990 domain-containing protein [Candidatus Egerieousia equi]
MNTITIYHGSPSIVTPVFGEGKTYNDYGRGFYCTENLELAKEWACSQDSDGYANQYVLNLEGLNILYLNEPRYNILNWLAILLENRRFSVAEGLPQEARKYILETFLPEYKSCDIIKGYRADDSYFSYARDFISNTLSLQDLKQAMMLGKLGEQVVLKSERAFAALTKGEIIPADRSEYYARYCERDRMARENYRKISSHAFSQGEIYVIDLIRGGIKDGDPRL